MRRYLPVFVLLLLSPVVAEFVFGATPVSNLGGIVPLVFFYGGGAVLIRGLGRRRGPGWRPIILLGAAYGIFEEGLVIQSMFNPDLFNAARVGGRAMGVNWIWSEWTVGYHVIYSVVIPIMLSELLFPARKAEPWLGWKGLTVVGVLFILSAVLLGVVFRRIIAPDFRTPLPHAIAAALITLGLVAAALRGPADRPVERSHFNARRVPSPWLVGLLAFLAAAAWFGLLLLPQTLKTGSLALLPMLSGVALAAGMTALLRRWSNGVGGWSDLHRLALVIGALPPMMLFGFFLVTASNRVDQIGQGIASVVTLVLLSIFAVRLRRYGQPAAANESSVPILRSAG